MTTFESPQLAATRQNEQLRPIAVDFDESRTRATVLVLTPSGDLILRFCTLTDAGWSLSDRDPASSANLAWSSQFASNDPESVLTLAQPVPAGVREVTVRFGGHDRRVDAPEGYFIASWWGAAAEDADRDPPHVVQYHR